MSSPANTIRLGLIGAGPWGRNYIKTIRALKGVALTRLASRNSESLTLAGSDCLISEDWRDLVSAGDLDGIIIATPLRHHAEMALAAIDAGVAVLVEKPMTLDMAEAEAVVDAVIAKDAILRVNHIHLYSAAWEALKREALALSPLRAISTVAGDRGPFRPDAPVLWDWGAHDIAMCIDLVGKPPKTAKAHIMETGDTAGMSLALELNFGPVTAKIAISNMLPEKQRLLTAAFENGELIYDDTKEGGEKLRLKTNPRDPGGTFMLGDGTPLERAVLAFADAIRRGDSGPEDVSLGRDVVRVLEELSGKIA